MNIESQHLSKDILEEYLMEKLPLSQIAELEEHLLQCDSCQDMVEELESFLQDIQLARDGPRTSHFLTHLPLYSLEAAAGKFGEQQKAMDPEDWVEVPAALHGVRLTREMFAIHVKGGSMEPFIADGSVCVFRSNVEGPYEDKVVLLEEYGEAGGSRYTVKRYHTSTEPDPHNRQDAVWLHERMTLESDNPHFKSLEIQSDRKVQVIGEFLFVIEPDQMKRESIDHARR